MKKYILLIILLLVVTGCSDSNVIPKENLGTITVCDETFDLQDYYVEGGEECEEGMYSQSCHSTGGYIDTDTLQEDINAVCEEPVFTD